MRFAALLIPAVAVVIMAPATPATAQEAITLTLTRIEDGKPVFEEVTVVAPSETIAVRQALASEEVVAAETPGVVKPLSLATSAETEWGVSTVLGPRWSGGSGSGVVVAVLDTGVQATHPDLVGRVAPGASIIDGKMRSGATSDTHGHGTHVAGIISAAQNGTGTSGVAPSSLVLPVQVIDPETGLGSTLDLAAGIVWAVDNGADVVNISLGSSTASTSVAAAVDYANQHDVAVIAAAGNTGDIGNEPQYPGALPGVVAVGAVDAALNHASFSTRGGYVSLTAPGVLIKSTYPVSTWQYLSGTSMAAPHVTGAVAALMSEFSRLSSASVVTALQNSAQDLGPAGRDHKYGYGVVRASLARNYLLGGIATPEPPPAPSPTPDAEAETDSSQRRLLPFPSCPSATQQGKRAIVSVRVKDTAGTWVRGVPVRYSMTKRSGKTKVVRVSTRSNGVSKLKLRPSHTLNVTWSIKEPSGAWGGECRIEVHRR